MLHGYSSGIINEANDRLYAFTFQEIINELSTLCYWNDPDYLSSSCTLDDNRFWKTCVLIKGNGRYRYLEELEY